MTRTLCSILLVAIGTLATATADEPTTRLRMKDGSFSTGGIVLSQTPGKLGWHSEGFEEPFHFALEAVRSVSTSDVDSEEVEQQLLAAGQLFEMSYGSLLAGQLLAMDDEWVAIESPLLGQVRVAREAVLALVDGGYAGQVVYSGPIDDERWVRLGNADDWNFEAGALVATKQGAGIIGNVDIPAKAQIHIVLSWRGAPDFVFSLGTLATNKVSKTEEVPSAARLEVWDRQLALVREVDGGADISMLSDLNGANPRVELTVYLDQNTGTVIVCDAHGRPLGDRLDVPSTRSIVRSAVHLANHGPSLSVERFEVRKWDGLTTTSGGRDKRFVLDADGELIEGAISGFDAATGELELTLADGTLQQIGLKQIRRGDFLLPPQNDSADLADEEQAAVPPPVPQPPQLATDGTVDAQVETPQAEPPASQPAPSVEMEVILSDRSRLRGAWLPADHGKLAFAAKGLADSVAFAPDVVRGIIGSTDRYTNDLTAHKNGTFRVNETQLLGYLEDDSLQPDNLALRWHPHGSANASAVDPDATGAIIYRKPLPVPPITAPAAARGAAANAQPMVRIFLGGNNVPQSTPAARPTTASDSNAREIMFRTGDEIDGEVVSIDERGMTFKSNQTSTTFATHDQVQHVWLNRAHATTNTTPEKLKRLMTVPRAMKQDPPTHLFISITGDYLRGRLVQLQDELITVEIRLELVQIPTSHVSQIIWLHDRDWTDKESDAADAADAQDAASELLPFRVHAIRSGDRGLTFQPTRTEGGILYGTSQLLGDCSVAIGDLNQLLFGCDIADEVRQFQEDPWTLSLAQYPRVFMDDGSGDGGGMGAQSPLVGLPAPNFGLKDLAGEAFRLDQQRERVVVLDFWASWCGPCVQTMPLVDEAVQEIGADKVHLVAVNIQEPASRVQAAVERLAINATVLLDVDGQVAAAYAANAIPQTVIIDREGKVTHLFVGGGARFVEQFKEALLSVTQ